MKKILLLFPFLFFVATLVAQTPSSGEINIISFNIRYDNPDDGMNAWVFRKEAVSRMINTERPDVLGIQEALAGQMDYLKLYCPDYECAGIGREDGVSKGEYAAIFWLKSRFSLIDSGHFWLSETPQIPSKGWDAACHRMVTWVQLADKESGKELFVFNTHLDHIGKVAREQSLLLISRKIKEIVGEMNLPVFLTGDFNSMTCDDIFNPLKTLLSSAREATDNTDDSNTYNGFGTDSDLIDHIFYVNATPLKFKVMNSSYGVNYISDHYPVKGTFLINK
ncbi:endonuclease/exonuclease/phosphatase family protein [Bacteroidales bacterium OttesenSCG-928-B11]|nr:endonuclease/exonuclease/phosphatase family protein [Bacteroidales bacterium OttesenSCG-928-E04]MDL2312270.1 endonuclease/exonuclease/phosphatase family protein [Bacteroidales bacterium OttesenSCG-928-B11]